MRAKIVMDLKHKHWASKKYFDLFDFVLINIKWNFNKHSWFILITLFNFEFFIGKRWLI